MDKKIGELNGIWAVMLRISLALMPFALAWAVWVTNSIFTHERTIVEERIKLYERMESKLDALRERIEVKLDIIAKEITNLKLQQQGP